MRDVRSWHTKGSSHLDCSFQNKPTKASIAPTLVWGIISIVGYLWSRQSRKKISPILAWMWPLFHSTGSAKSPDPCSFSCGQRVTWRNNYPIASKPVCCVATDSLITTWGPLLFRQCRRCSLILVSFRKWLFESHDHHGFTFLFRKFKSRQVSLCQMSKFISKRAKS